MCSYNWSSGSAIMEYAPKISLSIVPSIHAKDKYYNIPQKGAVLQLSKVFVWDGSFKMDIHCLRRKVFKFASSVFSP